VILSVIGRHVLEIVHKVGAVLVVGAADRRRHVVRLQRELLCTRSVSSDGFGCVPFERGANDFRVCHGVILYGVAVTLFSATGKKKE
jgi:hypothetical protein